MQGRKRTKLGLREFITLGEFTQSIDTERQLAVNRVAFSVAGLGMLRGALTIEASYSVVSPTRVDIKFESASLVSCSSARGAAANNAALAQLRLAAIQRSSCRR